MKRLLNNDSLRAGRPLGCLFAVLLGVGMASVIFVGSVMGDCTPGPGCHDDDGTVIIGSLFLALPIIAGGAIIVWLVSSVLRNLLQDRVPAVALNAILVTFTFAVVWFAFGTAFELFFWLSGSS